MKLDYIKIFLYKRTKEKFRLAVRKKISPLFGKVHDVTFVYVYVTGTTGFVLILRLNKLVHSVRMKP
jgi:hypothetical protein